MLWTDAGVEMKRLADESKRVKDQLEIARSHPVEGRALRYAGGIDEAVTYDLRDLARLT